MHCCDNDRNGTFITSGKGNPPQIAPCIENSPPDNLVNVIISINGVLHPDTPLTNTGNMVTWSFNDFGLVTPTDITGSIQIFVNPSLPCCETTRLMCTDGFAPAMNAIVFPNSNYFTIPGAFLTYVNGATTIPITWGGYCTPSMEFAIGQITPSTITPAHIDDNIDDIDFSIFVPIRCIDIFGVGRTYQIGIQHLFNQI